MRMGSSMQGAFSRRGLMAIALVAIACVVLLLAWGRGAGQQAAADEPHPGLDFSMAVAGVAGCDTTGGDMKCEVPAGGTFTVAVYLDELPVDIMEYDAFGASLTYSGVSSENNAYVLWPDCVWPTLIYQPGKVWFGCPVDMGAPPSTYIGELGGNEFSCTEDESYGNTITLVHGAASGDTYIDAGGEGHAESGTETITINCVFPTDSDADGCSDVREQGSDPDAGGLRDPMYFWDVFDTPDEANVRDKLVRAGDILRVVGRYGEDGDEGIDPLSPPPETGYHTAFDRGGVDGPNIWDQAPPNGQIRVADILAVLGQYGLNCQ